MKCKKLAEFGGDYRTKTSVRVLADEFLAPLNNGTMSPASTMTLGQWVEKRYLPFSGELLVVQYDIGPSGRWQSSRLQIL